MTVKLRAIIITITFLFLTSMVSAEPLLPTEFYGTVYIDGSPAPAGTNLTSVVGNGITGYYVTSVPGEFGGMGVYDGRLAANGTADGDVISFAINGIPANQTAIYHPGVSERITLSLGPAPPETTPTNPVSTQKPVVDTVNGAYGQFAYGANTVSSGQADTRTGAPFSMTLTQPETPAAQALPMATADAAVQPVSVSDRPAIQTTAASATSQTSSPTSSIPGYVVTAFVVLVVVFVGYGIIRSWLR